MSEPECPNCETNLLVENTNGTHFKCHSCDETFFWNGGKGVNPEQGASNEEWVELYNEYDMFYVPKNNQYQDSRQHIPSNGPEQTLCDTTSGYRHAELRQVDKSMYPPKYNGMCRNCLRVWRKNNE